jgi:hypothetical protein
VGATHKTLAYYGHSQRLKILGDGGVLYIGDGEVGSR